MSAWQVVKDGIRKITDEVQERYNFPIEGPDIVSVVVRVSGLPKGYDVLQFRLGKRHKIVTYPPNLEELDEWNDLADYEGDEEVQQELDAQVRQFLEDRVHELKDVVLKLYREHCQFPTLSRFEQVALASVLLGVQTPERPPGSRQMLEMNQRMERIGRELARRLKGMPWQEVAAALSYTLRPCIDAAYEEEQP